MQYDHLGMTSPPWLHLTSLVRCTLDTELACAVAGKAIVCALNGQGMQTIEDLFSEFARALGFPEYFGANWAALDECLMDLSWLPADGYVLLITRSDLLLPDDDQAFSQLIRLLHGVGSEWSSSVEEMTRPSQSAKPFHVLLEAPAQAMPLLVNRIRMVPGVAVGDL